MKYKIALGMYTVHKTTAYDMKSTFKKLSDAGYDGIEFYGEPSDFPADAVLEALSASGLSLTSWHIEWKNLQPDTIEKSIAYFHKVGLTRVIIPCLGGKWNVAHSQSEERKDVWQAYLPKIEAIRARLEAEGILLGYHNHEHEFELRYDEETVFDTLYQSFHKDMIMELDTGNAIEGGADPVAVMQKYPDRQKLLHLKPYSQKDGFNVTLGESGDLNDYTAILKTASPTCQWLIVESEDTRPDEIGNARACIQALQRILSKG